jgi:3-deoxy-manno-octulosonate cytidylyltransferase (CMP-KDO synthetase)
MINGNKVLIVIPARLGGYRFPDKPIRDIAGKPMIQWVWENASNSKYADEVIIATPDEKIYQVAEKFGAQAMMTSDNHRRGTERVHEVYESKNKDADIIVNFQGDEPLVTAKWIDIALETLVSDKNTSCVNLFKWMDYKEAHDDQNEVKVVTDRDDYALYFSRNALPALWLGDKSFKCKIEICVMPMWAEALEMFAKSENCYYEEIESVDMMRFIEYGRKVKIVECSDPVQSVDCQEDLIKAEQLINKLYF